MKILYRSFTSTNEDCAICLLPLNTQEIVEHSGLSTDERIHPLHIRCLQDWITKKKDCPICREPIDTKNLIKQHSMKERFLKILRPITIDFLPVKIFLTIIGISLVSTLAGKEFFREGNIIACTLSLLGKINYDE